MKNVGYYNGKIGPLEEMTVPMNDRALYFGDGVYDATMFDNNIPFALDEHLDRFYNSCRLLSIRFPMEREALAGELQKCIDAADDDCGMLYWQTSRGTYVRSHEFPPDNIKPNLLINVRPKKFVPQDLKYRLITVEDTRFLHCNIKTLNLIPSVMAYEKAVKSGCNEAVFHRGDTVTECAHSNVSIIKDGVFITHPADNLILPGIARKHLIELSKEIGIPVYERAFDLSEMMNADEVAVSSSTSLCIAACEIDGTAVGGKAPELIKKLQTAYKEKFLKYIKQKSL
ncbi:MAG: aminotransferase class IV [Oscillospiraceae bacterium]